jgi:hypothetical protein
VPAAGPGAAPAGGSGHTLAGRCTIAHGGRADGAVAVVGCVLAIAARRRRRVAS